MTDLNALLERIVNNLYEDPATKGDVSFVEAWEKTGNHFGVDALEDVRTGWDLRKRTIANIDNHGTETFDLIWSRQGCDYGPSALDRVQQGWELHIKYAE
jgi:hypothetical protein